MLSSIEISAINGDYSLVEFTCRDENQGRQFDMQVPIQSEQEMLCHFIKEFQANDPDHQELTVQVLNQMGSLFQEIHMAAVMSKKGETETELVHLLPVTLLHFTDDSQGSFRKSATARVALFWEQAMSALRGHRFELAVRRLDWILHLQPDREEVYGMKVVALRSSLQYEACVPVFEQWIEVAPKEQEPYLGLGEIYLFLGRYEEAKQAFSRLLALAPSNPMALTGLAQAKARLGEDMMRELMKASMLDPHYTKDMVENFFDFRSVSPEHPQPMTLLAIADRYQIPLKRMINRACKGVLPSHGQDESGLMCFDQRELDRYYEVLKKLGLEISSANLGSLPVGQA